MAHRLNLRQIEAFRAVFLTGSMTAAGEIMGVSQPAISRLIRDLEAETGLRLFHRKGTRITATPDAVLLSQEVLRSFQGLDRIARAAEEIAGQRHGELRLIATPAPSISCLPDAISAFRERRPGATVMLRTAASSEVLDQMTMQQYDLGVAVLPPEGPGVDIEALPPRNAVCIMPPSHPLAAREVIRPGDLAGERLLALTDDSLLQIRIRRLFQAAGAEPEIALETSFGATLCALVARGMGVAVIDPLTAATFDGFGIAARTFEPPAPYELTLVFSAHRPRSDHALAFAELLRERLCEG